MNSKFWLQSYEKFKASSLLNMMFCPCQHHSPIPQNDLDLIFPTMPEELWNSLWEIFLFVAAHLFLYATRTLLAIFFLYEYVLATLSQVSLPVLKNKRVLLIRGYIDINNQDITIKISCSHLSNFRSFVSVSLIRPFTYPNLPLPSNKLLSRQSPFKILAVNYFSPLVWLIYGQSDIFPNTWPWPIISPTN